MWRQVEARRALPPIWVGGLPAQGTERGSSLVELAVVLSMLLVVLVGMADLGLALNGYIVLCNASREGARFGSLHPSSGAGIIQAVIDEGAGGSLTLTADNVVIEGLNGAGGAPIRVIVTYQMPTMLGSLIGVGSHLTIRSSTEMVVMQGAY